jgi:hypothetical protein
MLSHDPRDTIQRVVSYAAPYNRDERNRENQTGGREWELRAKIPIALGRKGEKYANIRLEINLVPCFNEGYGGGGKIQ